MRYKNDISKKGYVDPAYLEFTANFLNTIKKRTYELMGASESNTVLDVGCGVGIDTKALALIVGSSGAVYGVDKDPIMIEEAIRSNNQDNIKYLCQGAYNLPFEEGVFDSCRSERLFQHLKDPDKVLSEMVRVTKPGGRIVVVDADWGSLTTDSDEVDTERNLARFLADTFTANGYSGRRLVGQFIAQPSLTDVKVEIVSNYISDYDVFRWATQADRVERQALKARVITRKELTRLDRDLKMNSDAGCFFSNINNVIVSAIKIR